MNYFNINIDNDITYLLQEIGHNVKVNNIPAKAIINNSSMERTFDDKKIITHVELRRGYYVEYNNLFFIVLNEVNDKRYLSYYKGVMRRCNFDLKFIINDRLYLFPTIIYGNKFYIQENKFFDMSADIISITLPTTDVTRQFKELDRFIKFNKMWEVQGIDYTKDGLIELHCKITAINTITDDIENEIADRYTTDKIDRLNGNIIPIFPFDVVEEEPTNPEEPVNPENPSSISIIGDSRIVIGESKNYTVEVYIDGIKIDKSVIWSVSDSRLKITNTTDTTCTIEAGIGNYQWGEYTITATLVDDENIFAEKMIEVVVW